VIAALGAAASSIASGLFLGAAQPGFDLSALAWVGLLPLLLALRGSSVGRAFRLGWLAGTSYYALILYWIAPTISTYTTIEMPLAIALELLLAMAAGLFIGGFAAVLEWLAAAGVSRVIAAPALWIVIEWLRTFFPAAFPWGFIGYSQARLSLVAQAGDIAGIYGISALVVLANAVMAEVVRDGVRRHALLVGGMISLLVATLGYGALRLREIAALDGPVVRVGVVQANIDQSEKWRQGLEEKIVARHVMLTVDAVKQGAEIVIWPEAAVPYFLALDERTEHLRDLARKSGIDLLVGAPGYDARDGGQPRPYNQAWLLRRDGELIGPYDKIRLVPFGEYVPWGGLFGWVNRAVESVGDFGAGSSYVVFDTGPRRGGEPIKASALICYEAIFPNLTRQFVRAGAELLVNLSNDAWYGRTAAPSQLLTMIAFRAIENRVPLVRATNTGISAFVAIDGSVSEATPLFEPVTAVADVKLVRAFSLYALLGDWLVYASIGLVSLLALVRFRSGPVLIRGASREILGR
jgi:apolipoprotein N-acyltransferase